MQKAVLLTADGLKKLETELEDLKTVKRKEIAEKIKVALSFGDLSENSEYDEAKNDQAMLEARIADIEAIFKNYQLIDESTLSTENVHVGSTVKVKNISKDKEFTYKIVGSNDADPFKNLISDESPVGKGLLGAKNGDTVSIETPGGIMKYEILEISK